MPKAKSTVTQVIPDTGSHNYPLGSAESQAEEAMRLAKERNKLPETGLTERTTKMDVMNQSTAIDFLDGLSQVEREKYLQAEKISKGRVAVLGRYGW